MFERPLEAEKKMNSGKASVTSAKSHASFEEYSSMIMENVAYFEYTIRHEHLNEDCLHLLTLVFPEWTMDREHLDLVQCKDGITNKLMKCTNKQTGDVVLIRAYGKKSEIIIDRITELANFVTLSTAGLSPPLHARFKNGFVYGFLHGRSLKPEEMADPHLSMLIAKKLANWHHVSHPIECISKEPTLFKTLRKWHKGVPSHYAKPTAQDLFEKHIDMEHLKSELNKLESMISRFSSPVVFCHNDLLSGNIIYNGESDEVSFIDFEYGGNNYRGFDIGNHFCEYAGFECDYSRYPDKAHQMKWLKVYLTSYDGSDPSMAELERLYLEVNIFALCSHFYWGLWALVQAHVSDIDFDYIGYAVHRFTLYEGTKAKWFDAFDAAFQLTDEEK